MQLDPLPHVKEQLPPQVTLQVALSVQVTLPLFPTVTVHLDPPEQSMLHDSPQLPPQVA